MHLLLVLMLSKLYCLCKETSASTLFYLLQSLHSYRNSFLLCSHFLSKFHQRMQMFGLCSPRFIHLVLSRLWFVALHSRRCLGIGMADRILKSLHNSPSCHWCWEWKEFLAIATIWMWHLPHALTKEKKDKFDLRRHTITPKKVAEFCLLMHKLYRDLLHSQCYLIWEWLGIC